MATMERGLRLSVWDLDPSGSPDPSGPPDSASDAVHFVYALGGRWQVGDAVLGPEAGAFVESGAAIAGMGSAWLFSVGPAYPALALDAALVLSRLVAVPAGPLIVRADRVEAPAGAVTPRHRHQGPGIRRLVRGLLMAQIADRVDRIGPGAAWFETGAEPVVGTNVSGGANVFVRVMLLPAELSGGASSFIPDGPAEAAKPRGVGLQIFGERALHT